MLKQVATFRLAFEFLRSGGIVTTSRIETMRLFMYYKTSEFNWGGKREREKVINVHELILMGFMWCQNGGISIDTFFQVFQIMLASLLKFFFLYFFTALMYTEMNPHKAIGCVWHLRSLCFCSFCTGYTMNCTKLSEKASKITWELTPIFPML